MHLALWQLLWFDLRGSLRGLANLRRNWRQSALLLLMILFAIGFLVVRSGNPSVGLSSRFGPAMPFWALVYLMATWLTASADRGLVMRPAEVHFIAGGPFRERDVITINLIRLALRALVSAVVLSLIATVYVQSFVSALFGMWLLISVSLLVGMLASLSSRRAHGRMVRSVRRVLVVASIAMLLLLITQSVRLVQSSGEQLHVSLVAAAALDTAIGQRILPPLAWMFAPLASNSFLGSTLAMMPARLGVLSALVLGVYVLGGRYLEASTNRTDLSIAKRRGALRSGVATSPGGSNWTKRIALPTFGRWGGSGSVAWMQMVHSIRVLPRFLVFTITIVGLVLVLPIMVDRGRLDGWGAVAWMCGLNAYADFLLLLQLPVGFLGPVAQRELLKSLPIASWRIVFGQLAGPLIPLALLHGVISILFLVLVPEQATMVLLTSIALVPAALVLVANINLLGSWNIIRPRALQQRDALAAGRAMVSVWIFFMMLIPAIMAASVGAGVAAAVLSTTPPAYLFGAAAGLLASSTLYVALLARSFHHWQPTATEGGSEETEYDR